MQIPPGLVAAKDAVESFVMSLPGVTGFGIGMREEDGVFFDEVAIRIFVDPEFPIPFNLPEEVGGVAVCVVRARFEPCAIPDQNRYNELAGGIRISQPMKGHGTLGAIVRHTDSTTGASQLVGLSCYHVVGDTNGTFPHTVWQPVEPNFVVGQPVPHTDNLGSVLKVDFPDFPDLLGLSGEVWGWSDSAIFRLDDAVSQGRTISKKIVGHDGPPLMVDRITATSTPTVFPQNIRKRGFVTGLTRGRVVGAQNSVKWTPGGPKARLKNQLEIEGSPSNPGGIFCVKGDSGSLVLAENSATAIGLLWGEALGGTRGVITPIETVETRLGVKAVWT